jgi:hypothetical protein
MIFTNEQLLHYVKAPRGARVFKAMAEQLLKARERSMTHKFEETKELEALRAKEQQWLKLLVTCEAVAQMDGNTQSEIHYLALLREALADLGRPVVREASLPYKCPDVAHKYPIANGAIGDTCVHCGKKRGET